MLHRPACLRTSRASALSHPVLSNSRPVRCTAVSRAHTYGLSKAPAAGLPVSLLSRKPHTRRMATAARSPAASAAAGAAGDADDRVTWDVDITTYIPTYDFANIGLVLTVISVDGERRETELKSSGSPKKQERKPDGVEEDLSSRKDSFAIKLPAGFEPAAIWVLDKDDLGDEIFQKGGNLSRLYLKTVTLRSSSSRVTFIANTYIDTEQGNRQFVRDDAFSNPQLAESKVLAALMADELAQLRGEGKNENQAIDNARKDPDRIYRYATYNDLGGDITKTPGNIREPLGGSSEFPYPRRLDTNRPKVTVNGVEYEEPPTVDDGALVTRSDIQSTVAGIAEKLPQPLKGLLLAAVKVAPVPVRAVATPWTPKDDNFDTDKTRGFIGNAITGVLPGVFTSIDAALGNNLPLTRRLLQLLRLTPGREFDSVKEVLSLYDRDQWGKLKEKGKMSLDVLESGRGAFGAQLAGAVTGRLNRRTGKQEAERGDKVFDLLKYDVPRSLEGRLSTWPTDEEMGRMFLAGQNPLTIEVLGPAQLAALLQSSEGIREAEPALKQLLEGKSLQEWAAAGEAGEPRLFLVDYWAVYDLLDILQEKNQDSDRVMHAGRCVLFRRSDGQLVPVVIKLAHSRQQPPATYTPNNPPAVWQVAKLVFQSVDSGWHQLVSHWLRTHACVEPYLIATRRRLPAAHPVFRLLLPHFRYTLPINAAARSSLINAGGVIETCFSPGPFSMQLSSKVYGLAWRFKEEGLVPDLQKRGFLDSAGQLRVRDYPYAEDGLLLWEALQRYFTAYVGLYYADDAAVKKDTWLQEWWTEVKTEAHPEAPADGWVDLDSRSNLVLAACTIAWVASAHHAAVNFGQYDYSGWMPSHSSLCRRPAPARGSDAWQKLASQGLSSAEMFSYIAPPATATKVMSTVKLLSAHAQDEQYLSTDAQDWLPLDSDARVKAVFEAFVADMKNNVEPEIDRRNANPANISRNPATNGMRYTLLYPSSPTPGVTMQGVPYSISI